MTDTNSSGTPNNPQTTQPPKDPKIELKKDKPIEQISIEIQQREAQLYEASKGR